MENLLKNKQHLKELLEYESSKRNSLDELTLEKPDPLLVAREQTNHYAILLCALYGYGSAKKIVEFLESLPFNILDTDKNFIEKELRNYYYRFQNTDDVIQSFISLHRLSQEYSLEELFYLGYKKENSLLDGIETFIDELYKVNSYHSYGYDFLFGKLFKRDKKGNILTKQNGPYKRYNMFLRWMIRDDNLDLGLWKRFDTKDLILPLDTHTYKVSKKIGLLKEGNYNLDSALKITKQLQKFDEKDPIKYDFALYRIGQEKKL